MQPVTLLSATFAADHPQEDGRRWITERLEPSEGAPVESRYLAEEGEDLDAHLAAMGAALLERLNRPPEPAVEGDA